MKISFIVVAMMVAPVYSFAGDIPDVYACKNANGKSEYKSSGDVSGCKKVLLPGVSSNTSQLIAITNYGVSDGNTQISCAKFQKQATPNGRLEYWNVWLSGFVTAMNLSKGRSTSSLDIEGMMSFTIKYCKDHPLEPVLSAFSELDKQLGNGLLK